MSNHLSNGIGFLALIMQFLSMTVFVSTGAFVETMMHSFITAFIAASIMTLLVNYTMYLVTKNIN